MPPADSRVGRSSCCIEVVGSVRDMTATDADLTAAEIVWDLGPLLPEPADQGLADLLDAADARAEEIARTRGHVAELDAAGLAAFIEGLAEVLDLVGRAGSYAGLDFATDTTDPARGARMQRVEERATVINTKLLFFELVCD
ncbi:MAG: oligoendopeptidase [Actinomycetota bacterium]|nr:oligoendopeptidase [Actinomycetota bacterium]